MIPKSVYTKTMCNFIQSKNLTYIIQKDSAMRFQEIMMKTINKYNTLIS